MDEPTKSISRRLRDPWPQDTRDGALELYLQDRSVVQISEELGVPKDTITYWRKTDRWTEKRKNLYQAASDIMVGELLTEITREKRQQFDDYKYVRDVSRTALEDEDLEFKDKKQAADTLSMSLKGMSEILNESVPIVLLREVALIVLDEVDDEDTKQRIGERLVALGSVWGDR